MSTDRNPRQDDDDLRLFHTGEHPCGYWPDRTARDLVLDPRDPRLATLYPHRAGLGLPPLRRPRLPAALRRLPRLRRGAHPGRRFRPDRSQRRCLARNADVEVRVVRGRSAPTSSFALYRRYLRRTPSPTAAWTITARTSSNSS